MYTHGMKHERFRFVVCLYKGDTSPIKRTQQPLRMTCTKCLFSWVVNLNFTITFYKIYVVRTLLDSQIFMRRSIMVDYNDLTKALGELKGENVLEIARKFICSNPNEEDEKAFMEAAKNGISIVVSHFEMRKYTVGDLIYAKEILAEIMEMLLPLLQEAY